MRILLLFLLKWKHRRILNKFHTSKYTSSKSVQAELWGRVLQLRKEIRKYEPNFFIDHDSSTGNNVIRIPKRLKKAKLFKIGERYYSADASLIMDLVYMTPYQHAEHFRDHVTVKIILADDMDFYNHPDKWVMLEKETIKYLYIEDDDSPPPIDPKTPKDNIPGTPHAADSDSNSTQSGSC